MSEKNNQPEQVVHQSEVNFKVGLNKERLPVSITWKADGAPVPGEKACKAFMVSLWDGDAKQTFRLDLWTKDMEINEMNHFFYQSFITMAQTYKKATNDAAMADKITAFAQDFASGLDLNKKQ